MIAAGVAGFAWVVPSGSMAGLLFSPRFKAAALAPLTLATAASLKRPTARARPRRIGVLDIAEWAMPLGKRHRRHHRQCQWLLRRLHQGRGDNGAPPLFLYFIPIALRRCVAAFRLDENYNTSASSQSLNIFTSPARLRRALRVRECKGLLVQHFSFKNADESAAFKSWQRMAMGASPHALACQHGRMQQVDPSNSGPGCGSESFTPAALNQRDHGLRSRSWSRQHFKRSAGFSKGPIWLR